MTTITLHPEVAAAVLANREADLYLIWAALRALDGRQKSTGLVSVGDMIDVCSSMLGVQSNHAYRKIQEGIGRYWREPAGRRGEKVMGLLSQGRVLSRLQITMTRAEPFVLPLKELLAEEGKRNGRALKQILIGVVAARSVDHRPISVAALMEHTGQSESTIRAALRECPHVLKYPNYEVVYRSTDHAAALRRQMTLYRQGLPCRIQHDRGAYLVLRQIANTYLLPEPDRKPLRTRPKELRHNDKRTALNASARRYHRGDAPHPVAMNYVKRLQVDSQAAGVWGLTGYESDTPQSAAGKAAIRRRLAQHAVAQEASRDGALPQETLPQEA